MIADTAANWSAISQTVVAVLAVGGAIFTFYRWVNKHVAQPLKAVPDIAAKQDAAFKSHRRQADQLSDLRSGQRIIAERIVNIEAQLIPNHGTSLRDSNDRTEAKVDQLLKRVIGDS